jgi:hypothetical protein
MTWPYTSFAGNWEHDPSQNSDASNQTGIFGVLILSTLQLLRSYNTLKAVITVIYTICCG